MIRINRFIALEIPKDPTDYEDFDDIAPYNKLKDGKWTSLCRDPHPLYHMITNRFGDEYDGKLMWWEFKAMEDEIENKRKSLRDYQKDMLPLYAELSDLIREQKDLCGERCAEKLQKHLDVCDGEYKCTKDFICYECQFKENGRCNHYYQIERATERFRELEYYEYEDKSLIIDLKFRYERALAVKEDRLDEYLQEFYDD
jgi:hypothetical protein